MNWRETLGLGEQTEGEKQAAINGTSLFFGALIGANLGTSSSMTLRDYALVIALICLIVLYIHLAPVARQRWSSLAHLVALVFGLYGMLIHEAGRSVFEGPRPSAHIFVTVCFWLASIAFIELRPVTRQKLQLQAGLAAIPPRTYNNDIASTSDDSES